MTAKTAEKAARVPCPVEGCTSSTANEASMPAHVAMAHKGVPRGTGELVQFVGRRPEDEQACVGSNHVPDCEHFPAAPAAPSSAGTASALLEVPLDLVDVGDNVRVAIEELEELAASIAEHGVLQPVKLTGPHDTGHYLVVWGQRRTLASRMAGLATIPAIVLPPDADVDAHGAARSIEQLVENLHRADLNPIDRARAMRAVVDSGVSQAELAKKLGIGASTVANDLRLLEAPAKVRDLLASGSTTSAHVKAVLGLPADVAVEIIERAVRDGTAAHEAERAAKYAREQQSSADKRARKTADAIKRVQSALAGAVLVGTPVIVRSAWQLDRDEVLEAIAKTWPVLEGWGEEPDGCGCETASVDAETGEIARVCADQSHREARHAAKRAKRDEADARKRGEEERLEAAVQRAVLASVPPTLARILLRQMDDYSGKTWTEYGRLPDAEVAAELALRAAHAYGAKPIPVDKVVEALRAEAAA